MMLKTVTTSKRGAKTHAGGTLTESAHFTKIRAALRGGFLRYATRGQALQNAKHAKPPEEEGRHRVVFECNHCEGRFKSADVQVDHIVQAGSLTKYSDLPGFVERLYCEADGLQVLCKPCHKLKTAADRALAKEAKSES